MIGNVGYTEMKRKTSSVYQTAQSDRFKENLKGKETKSDDRTALIEQVNTMFTPEDKLQFTQDEWQAVQKKAEAASQEALWQGAAGKLNIRA